MNGNFPFVLEPGVIKISLYKDSLMTSKAYGTISNDGFMEYKTETKGFCIIYECNCKRLTAG